jgi:hypothetical protein
VLEDKQLSMQILREKKEKQLRKEAYLKQALDEQQSRRLEKQEIIEKIV